MDHEMTLTAPDEKAIPKKCTTLRKDLWDAGFRTGRVLLSSDPFSSKEERKPGWLKNGDSILDMPMMLYYGREKYPARVFAAEDEGHVYLYDRYDGMQRLQVIRKDISYYLTHEVPFLGG